jgi:hypothetical protein
MQDVGDRPEPDFETAPAYPTTVTIAGIVWIIFGGLTLLNSLVLVLLIADGGQAGAAAAGIESVGLVPGIIVAPLFIFVGVQIVGGVRGTARDTLRNGIVSIIFGLLNFGFGLLNCSGALQAGSGQVIQAGIGFLAGVGFFTAGVLALVGRSNYKTWRKVQKVRSEERLNR